MKIVQRLYKEWYTYDVHENCSFSKTPPPPIRPHTSLVHQRPWFFRRVVLGCPISNDPQPTPPPNDNQSSKRKHNLRITIICYQVLPLGRLSFSVLTHWSCLVFLWVLFIYLRPQYLLIDGFILLHEQFSKNIAQNVFY